MPNNKPAPPPVQTTVRLDRILQAVSIERGDRQRIYCPKTASMRRIFRLTSKSAWVYRPNFYPGIFQWELVRPAPQAVSWRGNDTVRAYRWAPGQPEPEVFKANWKKRKMRVFVRDDFRCQAAGCRCKNLALLTIHHIIPKSEGGTNALDNLQTLCVYHHALLHDALPKELRAGLGIGPVSTAYAAFHNDTGETL